MSDMSEDAKPPKAGPGFLRLNSTIYRLEMTLVTIAIILILFYWRLFLVRDLNVYLTIFWILWPDLGSFIPIGLAARGGRTWPGWGSSLYNFLHTLLVAVPVLVVWSFITGFVQWPLLGWMGHITMDRAAGYYLRASSSRRNLAIGQLVDRTLSPGPGPASTLQSQPVLSKVPNR
ncbi:DUF4260 family protein [Candidatus Bathyarchaeota archaeon]|nr:MAG: DUF4260 family protein [Candidatus Bathyarchaeota archaeon]